MRITNDEKILYKFLGLVKDIFANATGKTTILGGGKRLYCFTHEYIAVFEATEENTLVSEYNFDLCAYTLKQSPDKDFYLDEINSSDNENQTMIDLADTLFATNKWVMDIAKGYEFKLSKIADMTGTWLKDSDLKYLDKLKDFSVYFLEPNTVVAKELKITYSDMGEEIQNVIMLAFTGTSHPNVTDSTQDKMNLEEPVGIENKEVLEISYINRPSEEVEFGTPAPEGILDDEVNQFMGEDEVQF